MKTTPRIITALAIAGAFVNTAVQAAESGPYIRLDNGVNSISGAKAEVSGLGKTSIKFNSGYAVGGAVGYNFNPIALELQYDYTANDVKELSGVWLSQHTFLANVIYSAKLDETFSANVGLGAGWQAQSNNLLSGTVTNYDFYGLRINGTGSSQSDTALAAQLKTSLSAKLAENVSVDVGYSLRYVGDSDLYKANGSVSSGGTTITGSGALKLTSHWNHLFSVGLTYKF